MSPIRQGRTARTRRKTKTPGNGRGFGWLWTGKAGESLRSRPPLGTNPRNCSDPAPKENQPNVEAAPPPPPGARGLAGPVWERASASAGSATDESARGRRALSSSAARAGDGMRSREGQSLRNAGSLWRRGGVIGRGGRRRSRKGTNGRKLKLLSPSRTRQARAGGERGRFKRRHALLRPLSTRSGADVRGYGDALGGCVARLQVDAGPAAWPPNERRRNTRGCCCHQRNVQIRSVSAIGLRQANTVQDVDAVWWVRGRTSGFHRFCARRTWRGVMTRVSRGFSGT